MQQAIREILSQAQVAALDDDGSVVFYRVPARADDAGAAARRCPAPASRWAPGEFSYRITDEEARLNVNGADPTAWTGCWPRSRWTSSSATSSTTRSRTGGTPTSSTASTAPRATSTSSCPCPTARATANVQDVAGAAPDPRGHAGALLRRAGGRPGLGDLVTAVGRDAVNINTAPPLVLKALGLSDAEIGDVVRDARAHALPERARALRGARLHGGQRHLPHRGGGRGGRRAARSRDRRHGPAAAGDPGRVAGCVASVSWRPGADRMMRARGSASSLHDGRLTVVGVTGRGQVEHFVVEDAEDPAGHPRGRARRRAGSRARDCAWASIGRLAVVKAIELPRAAGERHRRRWSRFDLERHVPFPPEDIRFDWVELPGEPDEPLRVLVVAPPSAATVERPLRLLARGRAPPGRPDAGLPRSARPPAAQVAGRARRLGAPARRRARTCSSSTRVACSLSRRVPAGAAEELAREIQRSLALRPLARLRRARGSPATTPSGLAAPTCAHRWASRLRATVRGGRGRARRRPARRDAGRRPCSRSGRGRARGAPRLNLLPAEARPWTPSREQLVTAGMVGRHRAPRARPWRSPT